MRPLIYLGIAITLFCTPLTAFDDASPQSPKEVQSAFVAALLNGDIDALKNLYSEDAVSFPIYDQQRVLGPEGVANDWAGFLGAYKVLNVELFNTGEITRDDIGAAWGEFRITAVPKSGGEQLITVGRYMDIAKKIGDRWYYIADHASLPTPIN